MDDCSFGCALFLIDQIIKKILAFHNVSIFLCMHCFMEPGVFELMVLNWYHRIKIQQDTSEFIL